MAKALTLGTRNPGATAANLRQYPRRLIPRVQRVVLQNFDREFAIAQDLCPRDTHYQAEHMYGEITAGGLGYAYGFRESDFLGKVNPEGRVITYFYPLINEFGGLNHAAQPCIFPARDQNRPRFRRDLKRVLSDR